MMSWFFMGKYTLYVWSAYGLAIGVFSWHLWQIKRQERRLQQQFKRWLKG